MHSIETFFTPFIAELNNNKINYCVCGNYHQLPHHTDNDIDIWVDNHTLALTVLLKMARHDGFRLYLSNKTANGSNNFFYKHQDNTFQFLHVDLLTEGAWKSIFPLIPADVIRSGIIEYNGFNVANDQLTAAMHFIYPLVTLGVIRQKYHGELKAHCTSSIFIDVVTRAFGADLCKKLVLYIQQEQWDMAQSHTRFCRKALIFRMLPKLFNPLRIIVTARFAGSVVNRFMHPTGLSMAFIGPDGAGKTTIINSIGIAMERLCPRNMFRQMYWRPFLLPELNKIMRMKRRPVNVNFDSTDYYYLRQRQLKGGILRSCVYLLKLLYYWLDFILGALKVISITSRGGIVCFDRFYHDQLVYPQRFGFSANKTLMSVLAKFIYKPDVMFVLCPPSEVILSRKQEMPPEEVNRHVREYELLANDYGFNHIDTSGSVDATTEAILAICLNRMSMRYDSN